MISEIKRRAKDNHARIGIGVGEISEEIIKSAERACEYAHVVLVGDEKLIRQTGTELEIIHSTVPQNTLVELLVEGRIDGAVRGNLSATKTLAVLKKTFGTILRMALLETAYGKAFFLAPVGVDEGKSVEDKLELIKKGVRYIQHIDIKTKVGVLSGGRFEDKGRDDRVDTTLVEAELVTEAAKKAGIDAENYSILIEDAIKHANFIIAPDGISGNLIFRTLVFLGGGCGYGAPILIDKVFVDTSRGKKDYSKAIMFASALKND